MEPARESASGPVVAKERVVAIIGANGGIGSGIAERISRDATVVLGYFKNSQNVTQLAKRIAAAGNRATVAQVDVRDGVSVQIFFDNAVTDHGRLDAVVLSTGYPIPLLPVDQVGGKKFAEIVEVELIGSFNVIKRGIQILRHQTGPNRSICCVLTTAFLRTLEYDGMSAIPKAAVRAMIKQTARECGSDGIRINGIATGGIDTGMASSLDQTDRYVRDLFSSMMAQTPFGRLGSPKELADVAAFLISDAASFVTGQIVAVDGGYSA